MMGVEIQAMLRQFSMNAPNKIKFKYLNNDSKNKNFTKNNECKNKKNCVSGWTVWYSIEISFINLYPQINSQQKIRREKPSNDGV